MEVLSKQKHKKRRTRRNLDEIRKRSLCELKDVSLKKESILKVNNIHRSINAQISSKRLNLVVFNNTVRSEIVTRPLLKNDAKRNNNINHDDDKIDVFSIGTKKSLNFNNPGSTIKEILEHSFGISNIQIEQQSNMHNLKVNVNLPGRVTLFTPSECAFKEDWVSETQSRGIKNKEEIFVNNRTSCCSSVDVESGECTYEKFLKDLPTYLMKNFPSLTIEDNMDKNITSLKETYWESSCRETIGTNVKRASNKGVTLSPLISRVAVQSPMDSIQIGSLWQQSEGRKKRNSCNSRSSSSLSQFGSSSSNLFIQDSPEYIYFPHKLNQ